MADEGGAAPGSGAAAKKAGPGKMLATILVPVVVALMVTVFTPVGERVRGVLFPTFKTVRGSVKLEGKPLSGADISLDGKKRVTTDGTGAFAITKVKQGDHVLRIEALGARPREHPFEVKSSDAADLGALEVVGSLRLAGQGSGGFEPPDPTVMTFRIAYDATMWLEGDEDVLRRVTKVTYTASPRIQPRPAVVTSRANRFCHRMKGTVNLRIGEQINEPVVAAVTFDDGKSLELSVPGDAQLPGGRRPPGCT